MQNNPETAIKIRLSHSYKIHFTYYLIIPIKIRFDEYPVVLLFDSALW